MSNLNEIVSKKKKTISLLVVLSLITGFMVILQGYLLVAIIDNVFVQNGTFKDIGWMLVALLAVLLLRTVSVYLNGRTGISMAASVKADYRRSLLDKYANHPVTASLQGQSGRKVSVMLDTVDEMDGYFSQYMPQLIKTSIVPVMILAVVFTQHINTGIIMIITAPFIPIFMIIIGMQTKKKSEEQQEKLAAFSGRFLDTLQGLTTLKLFGRARQQRKAIETSSLTFRDATMEILKVAFTSSFMLELISMLSIGIVALELSIQLIIYENITFFTAFFLFVLVPEFYAMLRELGSTFHNGRSSMGAAKKIADELEDKAEPVQWGDSTLPAMPSAISLENLSYEYGEEQFRLEHINAFIPAYGQIAIAGRTGSGKTTLLHVITGLLPPSDGNIMINSHPLKNYAEQEWFDQLSYISQDPYLFSGTIAENIAIGRNTKTSRDEVKKAAEKAGIAEVINTLEKGYDTTVGEAGRGLSGGEKQRLALARAFLKKPSIILFDEPTTGLDLQTERILQSAISQLAQEATVITVAHRLHTIKNADTILFLANGRLVANGTHDVLIDSVPDYRQMVSAQQGGKPE